MAPEVLERIVQVAAAAGGLYALGQLAGFICRSALMGAVAAIAGAAPLLLLLFWAMRLDVPVRPVMLPLILLWLMATWQQMPAWINGLRTQRTLLVRTAWVLVPPLVSLWTLVDLRRAQVPELPSGYRVQTTALRPESPELVEVLADLERSFVAALAELRDLPQAKTPVRAEALPSVQQLRTRLTETSGLLESGRAASSWRLSDALPTSSLDELSSAYRRAGLLDDEFALHLDVLRLSRLALSHNDRLWFFWPLFLRERTCQHIADWANDERQTPERLEAAIPLLEAEFARELPIEPMMQNWAAEMLASLDAGHTPSFRGQPGEPTVTNPIAAATFWLLGERERQKRLVGWIAAAAPHLTDSYSYNPLPDARDPRRRGGFGSIVEERRYFQRGRQELIERWVKHSVGLNGADIESDLRLFRDHLGRDLSATRSSESAALLIVALQAHRLRHGEFPRDVTQLLDGPLTTLPRYPYTRVGNPLFEFRREGFAEPMLIGTDHILPAGQPVILAPTEEYSRRFLVSPLASDRPREIVISNQSSLTNRDPGYPQRIASLIDQIKRHQAQHRHRIGYIGPGGGWGSSNWSLPSLHDPPPVDAP